MIKPRKKLKTLLSSSIKCFDRFFLKKSFYSVTGPTSSSDTASNTTKLSTPRFSNKDFLICTLPSKYGFLRRM